MNQHFSLQEAKLIGIVDYLKELGYEPRNIRNNDYWYLSPLRVEKEPSFKVNRISNVWYDHGLGKGGSLIDFGILYYNLSIKEVVEKLSTSLSFHQQTFTVQQPQANTQKAQEALEPKIRVIAAKPLTNAALCRYLEVRKIPLEVAKSYCKEVDFELNLKQYFALGFENNSGGFELRSAHFKVSTSPKDVTLYSTGDAKEISVFEGFFSFLSYQALQGNNHLPLTNFLVLNSLSFFEKSRELMEKNEKIHLYLDRDKAGIKNTIGSLKWNSKYGDKSNLYKNHKDLNDYLVRQDPKHAQKIKLSRHL
ncbi:MAG TPA: toprim domain-containing protein [Chitinophagaceae bacterium]|nr:toprim domain-containing protein [Chitinophagaceae bacterium]